MAFFESLQVTLFVIRGALLPEPEDDADPFKGQGAHGGVMGFTSGDELFIIGLGPDGVRDRMSGEFVKGLAEKLRATPAPMDSLALAAAIQHRGDSAFNL